MIKNCYIHIPFCDRICSYCDFCKMLKYERFVDEYLIALEKEIKYFYKGEELDTLYIGGGTPSSLSLKQLEKLFDILSIFKKSKNIEYTIEGNFESTSKEKLDLYKKVGINRLSFGIETINKKGLELLDRSIDLEKINEVIDYSKSIGFNNINVDLIYALPNESIKDLKKDLDYIYSLDLEHISTYSLIIENNTKLKINGIKNIDEDLDYDMYRYICDNMKKHGYNHYEISNFCKDGYESMHNTCYWDNSNYYGFGLGASSYIENRRTTNTRSLNKYMMERYPREIEYLDKYDTMEYEVILNLRKKDGIDLIKFRDKYNIDLINVFNYTDLLIMDLLRLDNNHIYIPEDKWYISNSIIVDVIERRVYE